MSELGARTDLHTVGCVKASGVWHLVAAEGVPPTTSKASFRPPAGHFRSIPMKGHILSLAACLNVPCVDGSGLAREIFSSQAWSVPPCVRPVDAVYFTAGHNALRGSRAGANPAVDNAL